VPDGRRDVGNSPCAGDFSSRVYPTAAVSDPHDDEHDVKGLYVRLFINSVTNVSVVSFTR